MNFFNNPFLHHFFINSENFSEIEYFQNFLFLGFTGDLCTATADCQVTGCLEGEM